MDRFIFISILLLVASVAMVAFAAGFLLCAFL
jgi:hypothetical protein